MSMQRPIIIHQAELDWKGWNHPDLNGKSPIRWKLLITGERGPSSGLVTGIAELPPGASLLRHYHEPEETYYVVSGQGHIEIDDCEAGLAPGSAVYIPPNAKHTVRCTGTSLPAAASASENPGQGMAEADAPSDNAIETSAPAEPETGPFRFGGALRVNYVYGDYDNRRGRGVGDVDLETLSFNANLDHDHLIGRAEYRWYDESSVMREAWLGYASDQLGSIKAGLVRVPFGPGPFGVSTSWFFDQHTYVGLSDDMDLGVRWTRPLDRLTLDLAYYLEDGGHWDGSSLDAVRYGYDIVKRRREDGGSEGFEEEHQFNLRALYTLKGLGEVGASFQYGKLKGTNVVDDGADHYAASAHAATSFHDFALISQISYYQHRIPDDTPWGTGDLILMGGYDYTTLVVSEGWIPALSLRFNGFNTADTGRLDSATPYVEWSSIRKTRDDYNASSLWTMGAAWSWGGLWIYTEMAFADGNDFVGPGGDYGVNANNAWEKRFNVNTGYYFDLF